MAETNPSLSIDLLDCPACNQRLSIPVTLPCGSSVCAKCLHAAVDAAKELEMAKINARLDSQQTDRDDQTELAEQEKSSGTSESPVPSSPNTPSSDVPQLPTTIHYSCPVVACTYKRHLYRDERPDFLLSRILDILPSSPLLTADDLPINDLECPICFSLLAESITAPCGHHACRVCLLTAIDTSSSHCPTCRAPLPSYTHFQHRPANKILAKILETFHEEEYQSRVSASAELLTPQSDPIPIFVLHTVFPRTPTQLHIFEPRYRLLIQRCLSGNKRFGMVAYIRTNGTSQFSLYGTMLEIQECLAVPGTEREVRDGPARGL